jgi:hypothetical protein
MRPGKSTSPRGDTRCNSKFSPQPGSGRLRPRTLPGVHANPSRSHLHTDAFTYRRAIPSTVLFALLFSTSPSQSTMAFPDRFCTLNVLINREIRLRNGGELGSMPDDVLVSCVSSCKSTWLAHGGPGLDSSIRNVSDSGVWTFNSDILALKHCAPIELSRRIATFIEAHSDVDPRCERVCSPTCPAISCHDPRARRPTPSRLAGATATFSYRPSRTSSAPEASRPQT